eukprot:2519920-Ditylum_brightwellii.AAC.1
MSSTIDANSAGTIGNIGFYQKDFYQPQGGKHRVGMHKRQCVAKSGAMKAKLSSLLRSKEKK